MGFFDSLVGTVGTVVGGAVGSIIPGGTAAGAMLGGAAASALTSGGTTAPCPGQPSNEAVITMLRSATPSELDTLRRLYSAANSGRSMPSDPFTLARHAMGGDDCAVSTTNLQSSGNQLKRYFLELVARYARTTTTTTSSSPIATVPVTLPPDPYYGIPEVPAPTPTSALPAPLPSTAPTQSTLPAWAWIAGIVGLLFATGTLRVPGGK
jgi:hypothetical protein